MTLSHRPGRAHACHEGSSHWVASAGVFGWMGGSTLTFATSSSRAPATLSLSPRLIMATCGNQSIDQVCNVGCHAADGRLLIDFKLSAQFSGLALLLWLDTPRKSSPFRWSTLPAESIICCTCITALEVEGPVQRQQLKCISEEPNSNTSAHLYGQRNGPNAPRLWPMRKGLPRVCCPVSSAHTSTPW